MRRLLTCLLLCLAACGSPPKLSPYEERYEGQRHQALSSLEKGDLESAERGWMKALDLARLMDDVERQANARLALAQVVWLQGREEVAIEQARFVGETPYFGRNKAGLAKAFMGQMYLRAGQGGLAQRSLEGAAEACRGCDWQAYLDNLRSSLYLAHGDLDKAEDFAKSAADDAAETSERSQALRNLAAVQFKRGQYAQGSESINRALLLDRQAGRPEGLAASYALLVQNTPEGQTEYQAARSHLFELCQALPVWVRDCQGLKRVGKSS